MVGFRARARQAKNGAFQPVMRMIVAMPEFKLVNAMPGGRWSALHQAFSMRCALVLSRGSCPLSTSYFERRVDDVMPDLVFRKLACLELIARCVREAVYWQDQLAVDMLLELKADPSIKNSDGETPMDRSVAHHDQMWRRVIPRCRA